METLGKPSYVGLFSSSNEGKTARLANLIHKTPLETREISNFLGDTQKVSQEVLDAQHKEEWIDKGRGDPHVRTDVLDGWTS
jgi:hypothetical protein